MGSYGMPPPTYTPGPYNTGQGGGSAVSGGYNPFAQRDVYNMYQNMGQSAYQGQQDYTNSQGNIANYFGQAAGQATQNVNDLYNPIWQGGGGYTPDQLQQVQQSQGLGDLQSQAAGNQAGQVATANDPYNQFQSQYQNEIKPQIGQYATALDQNVAGGEQKGNDVLSNLKSGYDAAIDPTKLSVSQGYQPGIQSTLQQGRGDVMHVQNDPGLNVTDQYQKQAGMSDQEVRDAAESAARGVGAQFGATKDQLLQNAEAAGTGTPMGIASAMAALDRSSAASQADALTSARLQARQQQMNAAQNVQNTQLNAGQYRAGLGSSNALALQNSGIAANTTAEQLRLGANQNLSQAQTQAATNLGQAGLGQANFITNAAGNALTSGQQAAQTAQMTQAGTGAGLQQQGWANTQGAQQLGFGNQFSTTQAKSGNAQAAYRPWVNAQVEGRAAAQGQQGYLAGQGQNAADHQLTGQGLGQQATQAAAAGYSGWGQNQQQTAGVTGFINNLGTLAGAAKAASGVVPHAHGGMIDHHQLIEVGEHDRPEVILPLDPATPPQHWNQYERMGAHLGEAMGVRPKGYANGGIIGIDAPNLFARNAREMDEATDPDQDRDIEHFARGGMMPHLGMPHLPTSGLRLSMPIRMPHLSSPIRPESLPHPKFARGGIMAGSYRMNAGQHNRPMAKPYSEMGMIGAA